MELRYRLSYILMIILFVTSCVKPVEKFLPPETTIGKNTMGCIVNGVLHVYDGKPTMLVGDGVEFYWHPSSGNATIFAIAKKDDSPGDVTISVYADTLQADFIYQTLSGTNYHFNDLNTVTATYEVIDNDPFNYVVLSRIDDHVAAGTFQFRVYKPNGDSMIVRHGRFDIAR